MENRMDTSNKKYNEEAAKWFLLRLSALTEQMEETMDCIRSLQAQAERTTAWLDPVGGGKSSGNRDFGDIVVQIESKKEAYQSLVAQCNAVFVEIGGVIDCIDNPKLKMVLRKKYLEQCSVSEIARQMDRSEKHIYRLLKEGLAEIELPSSVYEEYEKHHTPKLSQRNAALQMPSHTSLSA